MATARQRANAYAVYSRQCAENIQAIIADVKVRRHLTDAKVAEAIGMKLNTFRSFKRHPQKFKLEHIWMICVALDVPEEQRKTIILGDSDPPPRS